MVQQSNHFVAMPVFSLEDGEQVGTVKEIVIDNKALEISALIIEPKGFFKEQKIIPYIKVKNVGNDAITIERSSGVTTPTNLPNILSLIKNKNSIIGVKVITETGLTLGYVDEYLVDDETGKIVAFELGGKITGLLNGKARLDASCALRLGKDALIVKDGSEEELEMLTAPIKDSFKNFSSTASKWLDNTVDKTKQWSKNVGEKLSKIASEEMPTRFNKKSETPTKPIERLEEEKEDTEDDKPPSEELF